MFCLVRSLADLFERLRSLPGNDQFTLEYSIRYKTAKPAEAIIILLLRRRKASHFESAIPAEEHTIPAIEPQRILPHGFPPSSHRPPQLSTALGLGRVIVSAAQGPFGLIPVRGALVPRGT